MTVVSQTREEEAVDGAVTTVRIDTFHCATCQSFVRSEEHVVPASSSGS